MPRIPPAFGKFEKSILGMFGILGMLGTIVGGI